MNYTLYPRCCSHPMGLIGEVFLARGRMVIWRCNRCDRVTQVREDEATGYECSHQLPEFHTEHHPRRVPVHKAA